MISNIENYLLKYNNYKKFNYNVMRFYEAQL